MVEEQGMCGTAEGFLVPILEPFVFVRSVHSNRRLSSRGEKFPMVALYRAEPQTTTQGPA